MVSTSLSNELDDSTVAPWPDDTPGLLILPSGARVRGRALQYLVPAEPSPTLSVHLAGRRPPEPGWERLWVRWRDFCPPSDPVEAVRVLREAHRRLATDRVEVACRGGVGRTGTALAAFCILDGLDAAEAVTWVRRRYDARAVETALQRRFLRRLATG